MAAARIASKRQFGYAYRVLDESPLLRRSDRAHSIGLISASRHNLTQTLVQPLLTPPGMKAGKTPGVLNNPHLRPLSLKLGE